MILHVHHDRFHSFVMESFNITEVSYPWDFVDMFHDVREHLDPNTLFKQQPNWGLDHLIVEVSRLKHTHTHTHTLSKIPLGG